MTKRTITNKKITQVKKLLGKVSIHEAARRVGVSYKTAWHISKGDYDDGKERLYLKDAPFCPITGFRLY